MKHHHNINYIQHIYGGGWFNNDSHTPEEFIPFIVDHTLSEYVVKKRNPWTDIQYIGRLHVLSSQMLCVLANAMGLWMNANVFSEVDDA